MKYTATILGLLLVGVCSGQISDLRSERSRQDDDQTGDWEEMLGQRDMSNVEGRRNMDWRDMGKNMREISDTGDMSIKTAAEKMSMGKGMVEKHSNRRDMKERRNMIKSHDEDASYSDDLKYAGVYHHSSQHQPSSESCRKEMSSLSEIKNFISQKSRNLSNKVMYDGQTQDEDNVATVYSSNLPSFEDPMRVGNVENKMPLGAVSYKNVEVYGLSTGYQASYRMDTQSKQVTVTIPLEYVQISGQYLISNLLKHTSGSFQINLTGHVAYVQTVSYELKGGQQIYIGESRGHLQYDDANPTYHNIGSFESLLPSKFGGSLEQLVNSRLYNGINQKLVSQIQQHLEQINVNFECVKLVSAWQQSINDTFNGIRGAFSQDGKFNMELSSEKFQDVQSKYNNYNAKIVSVGLQNAGKCFVKENQVFFAGNKIHAHIRLSCKNVNALTTVAYQNGADAERREMHAQYYISSIETVLKLHKELDGGANVELHHVGVHVKYVRVGRAQEQHYEGELEGLVQHLAMPLESYLENALESFFTTAVNDMLGKGSAPESHRTWRIA